MESSPSSVEALPPSSSTVSSPRSELSVKAQSSFFNNLMQNGYPLELQVKGVWKPFFYKFSAVSCALESRKPSGTLLSFITLRRFGLSPSKSDPLQFSIKTPNKAYLLRARDTPTRTLWLNWLQGISKETSVMAEHAKLLSGNKVLTATDADRPDFWIPHTEGDFCASCHNPFSLASRKRTCRDCGFLYCHTISCFTDGNIKRCNACVVKHKAVGQDGKPLISSAATPTITEATTSQQRVYFHEDEEDQKILDQLRQRPVGFRASDLSTATQSPIRPTADLEVSDPTPSTPAAATANDAVPETAPSPQKASPPSSSALSGRAPTPSLSSQLSPMHTQPVPEPQPVKPSTTQSPVEDIRSAQVSRLQRESQWSDYAFYAGIVLVIAYLLFGKVFSAAEN